MEVFREHLGAFALEDSNFDEFDRLVSQSREECLVDFEVSSRLGRDAWLSEETIAYLNQRFQEVSPTRRNHRGQAGGCQAGRGWRARRIRSRSGNRSCYIF